LFGRGENLGSDDPLAEFKFYTSLGQGSDGARQQAMPGHFANRLQRRR